MASGAGAVAPAWPADSSSTGIPARTQCSIVMQLSSANFMGGTTKQFEFDTKGRSRHAASPPATVWISSMQPATWSGSEKEVPTCFVVPARQA
jgi:hypothetical protein